MSARRITRELADGHGFICAVRTVTRWLDRLGLNRLRDITPDGENLRSPGKIIARYPGHMVHMDVKKVGQIPDGGGWWAHGRGSEQVLAGKRDRKQEKVGYTYLHSMEDGFSRLSYTEPLENEKASTTIGFFHRARVFFAAHGITRITRLVTDNGSNYTASAFRRSTCAFISRHQRTRIYTPRHNGKIERYQRVLAEECLYARPYAASETERREAIAVWVHHYNYCESLSGWSGTGWQGERQCCFRAEAVALTTIRPHRVRFDGHVRLRRGVAGARPADSDGLIRRTVRPRILREVVTHHRYCPEVTSIQARAGP